jgi:hypothetical protein
MPSDPRFMPCVMIICSILAALMYASAGDFRRSVYWLAAAVLNITVTF